eukprot:TCONS_00059903-protein
MDSPVYDEIPQHDQPLPHPKDEEAALIETTSTDSLDTTATHTNRSLISRMNDTILATQVNLHERVSDWGIRTENILALFWGGIVFFIGLSFNIAQSNTSLVDDSFATIYWVILSFMFVGISFMAIAIHHRDNENVFIQMDKERLEGNNIRMLQFLTRCTFVFALGLSLMDFISLVTVFHCGYGSGDVTTTQSNQYAAILMYHIARFIYASLQLILLQILVENRVRRSGYYQFCMKLLCVHVIVTNTSIWLTKFNQETGLFGNKNPTGEYDALNCTLQLDDSFFPTAKSMDQRLYPFILEFCLLSSALFYILYPFLSETQKTRQSSSTGPYGGYKYQAVNIIKDATQKYRTFPSLIIGASIALLLIVASWNSQDLAQKIHNMRFTYAVQILVFILLIIFCRVVLTELKEHHRSEHTDQNYKIEDILLILSGPLGFLPFCLLVLFASFAFKSGDVHDDFLTKNKTELRIWSSFWSITSLLSVFIQTHFLIVGRNFRRDIVEEQSGRHSSGDPVNEDEHYAKRIFSASKISQLVIVILFSNFGLWFLESFFETDSPFIVAKVYWGEHAWLIISKLLYPLIVFFRFHSVAILTFIWFKFRVK